MLYKTSEVQEIFTPLCNLDARTKARELKKHF